MSNSAPTKSSPVSSDRTPTEAPPCGQRLRWARLQAGLSARALDRLAGRREGHAAAIETRLGDQAAGFTLVTYATVLGLSLDWLLCGHGSAPDPTVIRDAVAAAAARAGFAVSTPVPMAALVAL